MKDDSSLTQWQLEKIAESTDAPIEIVLKVALDTDLVRRTMEAHDSSEYEAVAWLVFEMTVPIDAE